MNKLIIKVKEIKGNCVVYKGGEKIVIDGPEIDLKETDKICVFMPLHQFFITLWH